MRIAVSGANGFVGHHVLQELTKYPVEVVALLRKSSSVNLPGNPKIVTCEIGSTDVTWDELGQPDILIHLAWDGLPNYRSRHHYERELPNQYRFLANLLSSGLKSLLVAGTCFEYGMQSGSLDESLPTKPDNCYGFAKDVLRRQLEILREQEPFNLTWARLFYPYGEGQSANSLRSQFKATIDSGKTVFNMSGGEQLRDFLPVETVAYYLVGLARLNRDCSLVNICNGEPISVRQLVEKWVEESDRQIALNRFYYPYPDYEPMAFWGNARKLKSLLNG